MQKRFGLFIIGSIIIFYIYNYYFIKGKYTNVPPVKETVINEIKENYTNPIIKKLDESSLNQTPEYKEIENAKIKVVGANLQGLLEHIYIHGYNDGEKETDLVEHLQDNQNFKFSILLDGKELDLDRSVWKINDTKDQLTFTNEIKGNIRIEKSIRITPNEYTGIIELKITNLTNNVKELERPKLVWGPVSRKGNDIPAITIYEKGQKKNFTPSKKKEINEVAIENGWVGIKRNYFCLMFYNNQNMNAEVAQNENQSLELGITFPKTVLLPGKEYKEEINFYFGTQSYENLKGIGFNLHQIIDFGTFHYIGLVMLFILKYFYSLTKNYGLAIILLTLFIRILLWWPTQRSYTSMKRMQTSMNQMQPRLKTIKEIYKNDPQKLNEETMKLYREYKINPMGGCLPMLLQMPILFALWSTLTKAVELKGAGFIWIWKDLSLKDPLYILPIVMGISMFIQQRMSNAPAATPEAAAQQQVMLYFMPIFLTLISLFLPSGVLIYWVISNLFGIAQQIYINKSS